MGREIVYCDSCGERISAGEFEKKKAITIDNRNYCRKCAPSRPKAPPPASVERESTRNEGPLALLSKATSTSRAKHEQAKGQTRRVPIQKDSERTGKKGAHTALIIGLVVGGLVLLLLVILGLNKSGIR